MCYVVIFLLLLSVELFYLKIASKFNIKDNPQLRSSHNHTTLSGGGIIFFIAPCLWTIFFDAAYPWFFAGLTLISAISFVDDIRPVPKRYRIVSHFISMFMVFAQWGILSGGNVLSLIMLLVICAGIINAYNFMDGINGITGLYSASVLIPLMLLNRMVGFTDMSLLCVVMLGIVVFGIFNFRKRALCFAGDVGAVSIAFIFIFLIGSIVISTGCGWYIMLLAVYGVDSVLTIVHRLILRENIFVAHRKHVYQIMSNELHIPHMVVASVYMLLQLIVSLGLVYLPVSKALYSISVLLVLVLAYVAFIKKYYHLHSEYINSVK